MKNIVKQTLIRMAIYLPVCLVLVFSMYFYIQKKTEQIHSHDQEQEVYFKKYTGNLKQHISIPLQEAGISKEESNAIIKKLDTVLNMRRIAPRDKYLLTMDEQDNFKMLVVTKDFSRYYVAKQGNDLIAGISDISVKTRTRFAKGKIDSSLFASMQAAGLKPSFIIDFTDVFSWTVDFNTDTRRGDSFACYWQEDYTIDGETLNETILAAYYDGVSVGKTYALNFEDDFYDEKGKFSKKMFLKSPISFRGVRITSRFTNSRLHPILKIRRPHLGIDYAAPVGTPVESVADGTVIFQGHKGGFGNYLEIAHPNNYVTCYGHLKNYAKNIHKGARVRQGQTIAYVGSTGLSTGPHLDFRLRQGNKYMDFLNNKNRSSAVREIPDTKREEFNKIKEEYLKILDKE
jgi:hypothetical protein